MPEDNRIHVPGVEVQASSLGETEKWFFPTVVHLRLRDHSLLKFAPGPRDVPVSLLPAEKEILKRNGAKPIENKQPSSEAKSTSGEAEGAEGTQGAGSEAEGKSEDNSAAAKVNKKK